MMHPSFLTSLALLIALLMCSTAVAQDVECSLNVEYADHSVRISIKAHSAQSAMSRAIRTGCSKLCSAESKTADCQDDCIKTSSLNSVQCFDENDTLIQPDREKARKDLIASSNVDIKLSNNSPARKSLILTQWLGEKKKKKKSSLLIRDSKRERLLLSPKSKTPPLLL